MKKTLEKYRQIFLCQLNNFFEKYSCDTQPIYDAVKYSIENGGKRIRPALCYLGGEFCGKNCDYLADFAVCIEMIHSYSLVHDDLPCMDNDMLRRGKPTTHVAFGEGMAVLAGDALLNMAFEAFLSDKNFDENTLKAVRYVAENSGIKGMVGGQCIDLTNESKKSFGLDDVRNLNRLKTSCLIKSALVGAVIKCGASSDEIKDIEIYAENVGEIFQIVDDILDKTSTSEILGKDVNKDCENGKITVVDILGKEKALQFINSLQEQALEALKKYGDRAQKLKDMCLYLTGRIN